MEPGGPVRQIGLSYPPARLHRLAGIDSLESIPGLHEHLQIRALNRLNRAKFTGAAGQGKWKKISAAGAGIVLEAYFRGLEGLGKLERKLEI
jgi:hypothetical protein